MKLLIVVVILVLPPGAVIAQEAEAPDVNVTGTHVRAIGKWKGNEIAFKHVVEIECIKGGDCVEAQATLVHGQLDLSLQHYQILKWDADGLIAENISPVCVTNRLRINFMDKTVLSLDIPKNGAKGFHDVCKDQGVNHTNRYRLVAR